MSQSQTNLFGPSTDMTRRAGLVDIAIMLTVGVVIYLAVRLGLHSPGTVAGPEISLDPSKLPLYAALSISRMFAAYVLSMLFSLGYGTLAASRPSAERILLPLLDILQSVPILSFLPVVLLSLAAILPQRVAVETASIILIFTSQAWNMTFAWYQSLLTTPTELTEAGIIYRFTPWLRFKFLRLPYATVSLIWNSMMSWAGGWFFLMAAEIFTVGSRDFRLPGLGSYLQMASDQGNFEAVAWGLLTVTAVIIALDQFVWRPLLAWAERFKPALVTSEDAPTSWFLDALQESRIVTWLCESVFQPAAEWIDNLSLRYSAPLGTERPPMRGGLAITRTAWSVFFVLLAWGVWKAGVMLYHVQVGSWGGIALGLVATFARVMAALVIALAWTIPCGVAIGTNQRLANILQPLVQITASLPATAVFPVVLIFLVNFTGGLNVAAVLLMLMGTQWYLLFNVIAGAATIPKELMDTATLIGLSRWARWKTLILPALFPYIITGLVTAGGGAWNASIVSEYVRFGGSTLQTVGIGSMIAQATADGNYPLLLAATMSMVLAVVMFNRLVWRRLYALAEEKYRLE